MLSILLPLHRIAEVTKTGLLSSFLDGTSPWDTMETTHRFCCLQTGPITMDFSWKIIHAKTMRLLVTPNTHISMIPICACACVVWRKNRHIAHIKKNSNVLRTTCRGLSWSRFHGPNLPWREKQQLQQPNIWGQITIFPTAFWGDSLTKPPFFWVTKKRANHTPLGCLLEESWMGIWKLGGK